MSRVLAEHWSRLDILGAARGDSIAVAESMRPAGSTSPVRRSASVGTHPSRNCDPVDLLLANRRRSTESQASQPIAITGPLAAAASPPEEGLLAQGTLRAFSVPSITHQMRASALAAAVDADRQHGRGAAAQQLHQQRPPPAPSAGAGVSHGLSGPSGGALAPPELQPVLEHGLAQDAQSHPQLSGSDFAANQLSGGCDGALPMAGSTFALAGPRVFASAFSEAAAAGHVAVHASSATATPFRGARSSVITCGSCCRSRPCSAADSSVLHRDLPSIRVPPCASLFPLRHCGTSSQAILDSRASRLRLRWRCTPRRQPAAPLSACSPSPSPATAHRPGVTASLDAHLPIVHPP